MRLSLVTRIFLGYAVVLVTFGAVSLFSVTELHQSQLEIRLVSEGYLHLSQDLAAIETFHKNQERDTQRLLEEQNVETRRALIRLARLYFPGLMAQQLRGARDKARKAQEFAPPSEASFLREVDDRLEDLQRRYALYESAADSVFSGLERHQPDWDAVTLRMDRLKQTEASIGRSVRRLHHALESRILERVAETERRERRTGLAIIGLSVLAIGVGLLATAVSARSLRPVRTLIEGAARIRQGDYSAELGVRGDDEISVLAREFDAMSRALREREAQLRDQQEALVRAEQLAAAGRVSAQIAHEVRNPLSSIGLNVEMLEDQLARATFPEPTDAREVRDLLASVLREVDRLTEVTEQHLKLARPAAPSPQPEDVNALVSSVLDFSREELEQARIQVDRKLDPGAPRARVDEGQLRQVFLNLLRNGREAMAQGGVLTVQTEAKDGVVEVRLSDTGPGVPEAVKARLFEPFFSTKAGGTGLGLAVSRQIVAAHGGALECESEVGRGSTFVVRLPRAV